MVSYRKDDELSAALLRAGNLAVGAYVQVIPGCSRHFGPAEIPDPRFAPVD